MATRHVYLKGTLKWAKVSEDNMDTKFGEKYTVDLYPDEASMILFKTSGSRTKVREDDDGKFIKLSKDHKRRYTDKKTKQTVEEVAGPPDVGMGLDEEGLLVPFEGKIGNGSTAEIKIAVYDSDYGKGTRLEAVNILELVEYEEKSADGRYKF